MDLKQRLCLLMTLSVLVCASPAQAKTVILTQDNLAQILLIGGQKNLACWASGKLLGTLSAKEAVPGARLKTFRARIKIQRLTRNIRELRINLTRVSNSASRQAKSLKSKISKSKAWLKELKAAVATCQAWVPGYVASSGSSSSAAPLPGSTASNDSRSSVTSAPGSNSSTSSNASSTSLMMANSVSQDGITWTFDHDYPVGQFINGDWWVVGPVTITSVTPGWDGTRNGAMLDPVTAERTQGYDNMNTWVQYNESLRVQFPVTIDSATKAKSLVSVKSLDACVQGGAWECIDVAAVLTAVQQPIPDGTFRPPYVDGSKQTFDAAHINWSKLPTFPYPSDPDLQSVIEGYLRDEKMTKRVWLDHGPFGAGGGTLRPSGNMISYPAYHASNYVGPLSLLVMLDIPQRESLAIRLIQVGIDLYPMSLKEGHAWRPRGGYGIGRKWPILFAGLMLDDPGMKSPPYKLSDTIWKFGEDGHTYFGQPTPDYPQGKPLFGDLCDNFANYCGWAECYETCMAANNNSDLCLDGAHCGPGVSGDKDCRDLDGLKDGCAYFTTNAPGWLGQSLAARLMNAMDLWNHPPYFAMTDRWVASPDLWPSNGNPIYWGRGGLFVKYMWDTYHHCVDASQNDGEEGVDCGGNCPNICP